MRVFFGTSAFDQVANPVDKDLPPRFIERSDNAAPVVDGVRSDWQGNTAPGALAGAAVGARALSRMRFR
jgi:hypothetical protein